MALGTTFLYKVVSRISAQGFRCSSVGQLNSPISRYATVPQAPVAVTSRLQKPSPGLLQLNQLLSSGSLRLSGPKKPLSSYFLYQKDHYQIVAQQNPNAPVTAISKQIGQMWKNLSEEEKERYTNAAKEERMKYKQQLENLSPDEKQRIKEHLSKRRKQLVLYRQRKKLKELQRPKRPLNQYSLYAKGRTPDRGTTPPRDFFSQVAQEWREMSAEDKQPYMEQSKQLASQYKEQMIEWERRMKEEGHPEVIRGYRAPRPKKTRRMRPKKKAASTKKKPRRSAKRKTPAKTSAAKKKVPDTKKAGEKKSSAKKTKSKKDTEPEDVSWMREE